MFPSLNMAVKRREQALQDYKRLQAKVEKYEEKEKTGPIMVKLHQVQSASTSVLHHMPIISFTKTTAELLSVPFDLRSLILDRGCPILSGNGRCGRRFSFLSFNPAEAAPESIESQDQPIKEMKSGAAPA